MKEYLKKIPLRAVQMMAIAGLLVTTLKLNAQTYCTPTGASNWYVSSFTTTDANVNLNYSASSGVGYVDETEMPFTVTPGFPFDYSVSINIGSGYFYIWVDWNNNMIFDSDEAVLSTTSYAVSLSGTYTVNANQPIGTYRMRVATSFIGAITACGNAPYGSYVDFNITVVSPPTCIPVTNLTTANLTTSNATFTSVDVLWTSQNSTAETDWEIQWGTGAFNPNTNTGTPEGTEIVSGTPSYQITGLTPNTDYKIYVRADCGGGDTSFWLLIDFYSGYCRPIAGAGSYISSFTTTDANVDLDYSASFGGTSYVDATGMPFIVSAGLPFDYSVSINSGSGYFYIWVDWNNNMVFDSNEAVLLPSSSAASFSGTYTVDANQPTGTYRMRAATLWSEVAMATTAVTPCGNIPYGNYVDFNILVGENVSRSDFDVFGFAYYPNPVSDVLHLSSNTPIGNVVVSNMLGQQVSVSLNSDNTNLDLSNLPTGNYLVKVEIEGVSNVFKIVKK